MASTHTLTGNVYDLAGETLGATSVRVYVVTNLPAGSALVDKTTNRIHLGGKAATVDPSTGEFTVELIDTSATDLNVLANTLEYEVRADFVNPANRGRSTWSSGWFPFTADANLADITTDVEPLAVQSASGYALEAKGYRDEAEAISGLTGEDAAVAFLVEDSGSATAGALSATYVVVNEEPLNIARTAALDGVTDDTAAWNTAINAINAATGKVQIRHPGGVSRITSPSRLTPITNTSASIVGDQGTVSAIRFDHANGGLDIGDGTSFVYLTQLRNLTIDGGGVATLPLRLRKSEEAHLENVRFQNHPAVAMECNETSLFTSQRVQIGAGGTAGVKMTGACGSLTFHEANVYDTDEPFQIAGSSVGRLLIADSWIEACPDVVTFNRPGNPISVGSINIRDLYAVNTLTNARLLRAVASTSINVEATIRDSRMSVDSSTSPIVDFTAVDNSSATARVRITGLSMSAAALAGHLIKVHASQAWFLFHVDLDRITGVGTDKWVQTWLATGGVWAAPWQLYGVGTPEAVVAAPVGSTFRRGDGGAGTSFYVKQSGVGNTGWAAK